MMKRFLGAALALVLPIAMTGCNGSDSSSDENKGELLPTDTSRINVSSDDITGLWLIQMNSEHYSVEQQPVLEIIEGREKHVAVVKIIQEEDGYSFSVCAGNTDQGRVHFVHDQGSNYILSSDDVNEKYTSWNASFDNNQLDISFSLVDGIAKLTGTDIGYKIRDDHLAPIGYLSVNGSTSEVYCLNLLSGSLDVDKDPEPGEVIFSQKDYQIFNISGLNADSVLQADRSSGVSSSSNGDKPFEGSRFNLTASEKTVMLPRIPSELELFDQAKLDYSVSFDVTNELDGEDYSISIELDLTAE